MTQPPMTQPQLVSHLPGHAWVAMRSFSKEGRPHSHSVVHDHATLALYLGGEAAFWMQGLYQLGPGDVLLVPAGVPHYVVQTSPAPWVGISLCLSCAKCSAHDELVRMFDAVRRGGCASRHLDATTRAELERLLLGLENELSQSRTGNDLAVDALLSLITVLVLRAEAHPATERETTNPVVAKALDFVHRHACSGISLREVASHVSRSPTHVASLMKEVTGETVGGWITRVRLSRGRQLLLHTNENIDVVAERCGFASASHFHRAFKRAHDQSPGAWRRAYR